MVNNLQLTGGGHGIVINGGGLYTGGDTHINNVSIVNGSIYSGGSCGPISQCSGTGANEIVDSAPPQAYNTWDIDDFKPGNSVATNTGSAYHYVNGDLNSITEDGVYYVTGDVQIGGGTGQHRVTIVSEGTQNYTGKVDLYAYWHDLLFFSNSDDLNNGAIQISASDSLWQGLIYAPRGDVNMSAARNDDLLGAIYGQHVNLSGADININYDPASCPPSRARVIPFK